MARVFISHSTRDNELAAEIKDWLASRGFDQVFLDFDKHAGIAPGANWERELYRKIDSSQAVILIITPNWHESKWCFVEFAQARALGKAIFPIISAPGGERFIAPDIQQLDLRRDREGGLERLARELVRLTLDSQGGFKWDPRRPPYPGLLAFEKEDAAIFFGRDDDIRRLIERLNARRVRGDIKFVVLLGASGSGKSSVVRAGVLPRLEGDRNNWIVLPPFRPRRDPLAELARAACEALGTPQDWSQWATELASAAASQKLDELVDAARVRTGAREGSLLVTIDQGEELFSIANAERTSRLFELFTAATTEDSPVVVLMAMRSDYLGTLQEKAGALRFDEFSLGPFPLPRVRQIIEGPARIAGIGVEEELVIAAIADMKTNDALPLLAFTLRELHDRFGGRERQGGDIELSLAHYRMLGDPGSGLTPLEFAVQRRADEVLDELKLSDEQLAALREAFVGAMVHIGDEGQYVRRPAQWTELPAAARPILEELAKARLVVIRRESETTMVEVAHEALLRKWKRLRGWLDAERSFLVGKMQLRLALSDWTAAGEPPGALLQGLALARAREWLQDHASAISAEERRFIEQSAAHADAQKSRSARLRRLAAAGVAAFLIVVAGTLLLAREQQAASVRAEAASLTVQARSALSVDPVRAGALALQAVQKQSSPEARSVLLESVLSISPNLIKMARSAELAPNALAWSPESDVIAIAGTNGRLTLWRPNAASARDELSITQLTGAAGSDGGRSAIVAMAWNGGAMTTLMDDGRVITSDATGHETVMRLSGEIKISRGAVGAGGRLLVARLDDEIQIWTCTAGSRGGPGACQGDSIAKGRVGALAIDDKHSAAAIGFEDGTVRIIGFGAEKFDVQPSLGIVKPAAAIAFTDDGNHIAIGTVDGRLILTDGRGANPLQPPQGTSSVSAVAWAPSMLRVAAVCDAFAVCVWDVPNEQGSGTLRLVARLVGHSDIVHAMAFATDGLKLATAGFDDTMRLWTLDKRDRSYFTLDAEPGNSLTDLKVSADQASLTAGDDQGGLHQWSLSGFKRQDVPGVTDAQITQIDWASGGSRLATGDAGGQVVLRGTSSSFDLGSFSLAANSGAPRFNIGGIEVSALRWLPDGSALLVSGTVDGVIDVRSATGETLTKFDKGHTDAVLGLAVSPDGKTLLSSDANGRVVRWEIATRKVLWMHETQTPKDTVAFSQDGSMFLVAGNDENVLVFRVDSDAPPRSCRSGSRILESAAFGSDGKSIAAVSDDAVLHLWTLDERCEILASAPLPLSAGSGAKAGNRTAHRRHIVFAAALGAFAVTASTSQVFVISPDPNAWLGRSVSLGEGGVRAPSN